MTKATIAIRLSEQGCLVCAGILWLAGLSFGQATISLSPTSGPPTTSVLVSGSGFSANTVVDIYFDSTEEAATNTNGSGSFSDISIAVPSSAQPGEHQISAKQPSGDIRAQALFDVNTNWGQFHFTANGTRLNPFENLLSPSNVSGLGLKWSYNTSFIVESSPAVVNGFVYVGSHDGNLYALKASTGAKLWSYATGGAVNSSPAVANGVVYVGSTEPDVYALNASTGAFVQSAPAVANGVVYAGSEDNNVYALDASTGAKLWSYATGGAVNSSPAVANGVVYVGSDDSSVYALNATTGALLWDYPTGRLYVHSSPAVANGVVYIGSYPAHTDVYALNATSGALLWTYPAAGGDSSPAVANGVVYVGSGDGNVYAFGLPDGTGPEKTP